MDYKNILKYEYGIDTLKIAKTTGGWSADAYKVYTEKEELFLKVYDRNRKSVLPWIERISHYLPVVVWLEEQAETASHIPHLRMALNGQYRVQQGEEVFLLFDYINGTVPGNHELDKGQWRELAQIISCLHGYSPKTLPFSRKGLQEDLSMSFGEQLHDMIRQKSGMPKRLEEELAAFEKTLLYGIAKLEYLLDFVRQGCTNLVLCHTDVHNFNLIQGDCLYLLDWEGLCIAPPEADLYQFYRTTQFEDFMKIYRQNHPAYEPDKRLISYYTLRRNIKDIWEFTEQILYDNADDAALEQAYKYLRMECEKTSSLLVDL